MFHSICNFIPVLNHTVQVRRILVVLRRSLEPALHLRPEEFGWTRTHSDRGHVCAELCTNTVEIRAFQILSEHYAKTI